MILTKLKLTELNLQHLKKFFLVQNVDNPSAQSISTSYVEITGSKCEVKSILENPTILYKASFHMRDVNMTGDNPFVHLKLQKSNDNFIDFH